MSGGHFDYKQYELETISNEITDLILKGGYPQDILEKFNETKSMLRKTQAMVHRIDWLVSGDDGEDSFRDRWNENVK